MMKTQRKRIRRKSRARRGEQEQEQAAQKPGGGPEAKRSKRDRLPAFYAAGPMFGLGPAPPEASPENGRDAKPQRLDAHAATDDTQASAVRPVAGQGPSEHVDAFNTYRGTTRRPFDLTICREAFDGAIQSMF